MLLQMLQDDNYIIISSCISSSIILCHIILSLCMLIVCYYSLPVLFKILLSYFERNVTVSDVTLPVCSHLTLPQTAMMLIISPPRHMLVASAAPVHLPRRLSMEEPSLTPQPPALPHPPGPPSCPHPGAWWRWFVANVVIVSYRSPKRISTAVSQTSWDSERVSAMTSLTTVLLCGKKKIITQWSCRNVLSVTSKLGLILKGLQIIQLHGGVCLCINEFKPVPAATWEKHWDPTNHFTLTLYTPTFCRGLPPCCLFGFPLSHTHKRINTCKVRWHAGSGL